MPRPETISGLPGGGPGNPVIHPASPMPARYPLNGEPKGCPCPKREREASACRLAYGLANSSGHPEGETHLPPDGARIAEGRQGGNAGRNAVTRYAICFNLKQRFTLILVILS